ncbi:hypothetical protein [Frigoribacterium sp. UYMn621]|uniref:hypothetical protein n=1 Tax=Frigoribacterium sp. UYMn621 TaxID=3156343 RepID=UPI003390A19E
MPEFGTPRPDAAHRARHDGWADVLATMEHDLDSSDGALTHAAHANWTLPDELGELPQELRSRAASLLGAQKLAIDALEQRMLLTGRHLAALDSIPARGSSSGTAAYLDVTG